MNLVDLFSSGLLRTPIAWRMRSSILFLFVAKLDSFEEKEGVGQATAPLSTVGSRGRDRWFWERGRGRESACVGWNASVMKGVTYAKGRGEDTTNLQGYRQHKFPGRNKKLIFWDAVILN